MGSPIGAEGCIDLTFVPQYQAAWKAVYQQVCDYVVNCPWKDYIVQVAMPPCGPAWGLV